MSRTEATHFSRFIVLQIRKSSKFTVPKREKFPRNGVVFCFLDLRTMRRRTVENGSGRLVVPRRYGIAVFLFPRAISGILKVCENNAYPLDRGRHKLAWPGARSTNVVMRPLAGTRT